MVSLPLAPDSADPSQAVGFHQHYWLVYRPDINDYVRYPDQLTWFNPPDMTPGRGFWGFFDAAPASVCGSAPTLATATWIHLFVGWNLIGQPFMNPVKWDPDKIQVEQFGAGVSSLKNSSDAVGNYAWGWDNVAGSYYLVADPAMIPGAVATLDPWRAYWIKARKECDLILPPP